jgi:hypothetical protein
MYHSGDDGDPGAVAHGVVNDPPGCYVEGHQDIGRGPMTAVGLIVMAEEGGVSPVEHVEHRPSAAGSGPVGGIASHPEVTR